MNNYSDLPEITLNQIEHFFAHYKDLEPNKWVKIIRWGDAEEARGLVLEGDRAGEEGQGLTATGVGAGPRIVMVGRLPVGTQAS